ncbi:hypothetical protein OUZ56_011188 [Daphnia magna]|uniref:Uncharacterized protein n=1 Tax=Daphnia magna TaxID=35525 RepID=A0ABQ9YZI6_9CRUS|nr:hypothetical protein OUZ56_011188 [Daphnia magna]
MPVALLLSKRLSLVRVINRQESQNLEHRCQTVIVSSTADDNTSSRPIFERKFYTFYSRGPLILFSVQSFCSYSKNTEFLTSNHGSLPKYTIHMASQMYRPNRMMIRARIS